MTSPIRRLTLAVPLILAAAVGCSSTATTQQPLTPAADWANQSAPVTPPAMLTFGRAHTWPGGDTITVGQPRRQQTTSAYSGRVDKWISVDVTVHNAGPGAKQAASYMLMATANDRSVDPYAVSELGPQQTGFIAPGGTLHFVSVYQATDPAPVMFEVQAVGEQFDPQRPVVFYQGIA
ncbi:MAG TPA: hypothetical protein VFW64_02530 [Pseudonocardiaceae bacterium]|nr:hypothetical protein [Pseudonocardiaceae bacterium]